MLNYSALNASPPPVSETIAGNLPDGIPEREIEDEFSRFGPLRKVWVARRPSGFGESGVLCAKAVGFVQMVTRYHVHLMGSGKVDSQGGHRGSLVLDPVIFDTFIFLQRLHHHLLCPPSTMRLALTPKRLRVCLDLLHFHNLTMGLFYLTAAFVEFEDARDADDAIRKLDGFNGWRVELSKGPRGHGGSRDDRSRGRDRRCVVIFGRTVFPQASPSHLVSPFFAVLPQGGVTLLPAGGGRRVTSLSAVNPPRTSLGGLGVRPRMSL